MGEVKKEFTLFRPRFLLECRGWQVEGDILGWNYCVMDAGGNTIEKKKKQLFQWTDTYVIEVIRQEDTLHCLMIVLSIDAANCSSGD